MLSPGGRLVRHSLDRNNLAKLRHILTMWGSAVCGNTPTVFQPYRPTSSIFPGSLPHRNTKG
jgi:hypothetical protein